MIELLPKQIFFYFKMILYSVVIDISDCLLSLLCLRITNCVLLLPSAQMQHSKQGVCPVRFVLQSLQGLRRVPGSFHRKCSQQEVRGQLLHSAGRSVACFYSWPLKEAHRALHRFSLNTTHTHPLTSSLASLRESSTSEKLKLASVTNWLTTETNLSPTSCGRFFWNSSSCT